jgi:hypothetical protein
MLSEIHSFSTFSSLIEEREKPKQTQLPVASPALGHFCSAAARGLTDICPSPNEY